MQINENSLRLDHLGIVAAMYHEIGIGPLIDEFVGVHHHQTVNSGQAVLAMILNMLAIFQRPLYLTSEFFEHRPVDRLISADLKAKHFTDDVLGRTLDRLYDAGLETLFLKIAATAQTHDPDTSQYCYLHADTTSITVEGEYRHLGKEKDVPVHITRGYTRDKKKGLKQFIISMITCRSLPVFLTTLSGNSSDKTHFRQLILQYGKQIKEVFEEEKIFVFDSAFYVEETIKSTSQDFQWITRVPETIKEAVQFIQTTEKNKLIGLSDKLQGYHCYSKEVEYGGVEQRWILVYSSKAFEKEKKSLLKKVKNIGLKVDNAVWHLGNPVFSSKKEAKAEAKKISKSWDYHEIKSISFIVKKYKENGKRGRPSENEPMIEKYRIQLKTQVSKAKLERAMAKKGRFIVATNIIDASETSDAEVLQAYKNQQYVERGFRFLKDPMFFVDGVYLEKPERIMAMAMLLGVSLLVYSLTEKKLRKAFEDHDEFFADRHRKHTARPTIRRVYQVFEGIEVRYLEVDDEIIGEKVLNQYPEQRQVLRLLGPNYKKMYEDKGMSLESCFDQFVRIKRS